MRETMKRMALVCVTAGLALLSTRLCAVAPLLSLQAPKTTFLIGETIPLTLTISNPSSSEPLVLATTSGDPMQARIEGLEVLVWDGTRYVSPDYFCGNGVSGLIVRGKGGTPPSLTILPGQCRTQTYMWLFAGCRLRNVPPGSYQFQLALSTEGLELPPGIWQGSIASTALKLELQEPQGEDKQYIDQMIAMSKTGKISLLREVNWDTNPMRYDLLETMFVPELLDAYPRSVYAAWAVTNHIEGTMANYGGPLVRITANNLVAGGARLQYLAQIRSSYIKDQIPGNIDEIGKLPYLVNLCRMVLKYHPDLEPAASLTRLNLGALLYISGDTPGAREQLETLIKASPDSDEGKAANQMLEVITISPDGAPPAQQAPAAPAKDK